MRANLFQDLDLMYSGSDGVPIYYGARYMLPSIACLRSKNEGSIKGFSLYQRLPRHASRERLNSASKYGHEWLLEALGRIMIWGFHVFGR